MKILAIHADFIEFEAKKKAFKGAEEGVEKGEKERVEECLVILSAVEKRDEADINAVIQRYVQEIKNIAQQVNAKNIVLYPYAHLSSSLSNPKIAENVLKEAEKILQDKFTVSRAPFGWYKSFNLSCKGHPLSELSREFSADPTGDSGSGSTGESIKKEAKTNLKREAKDEPFEFNDEKLNQENKIKLSTAAVVAKAVKNLHSSAKIGSMGFYYDQAYVDISGVKLKNEDIKKIKEQVKLIIKENLSFVKKDEEDLKDSFQKDIAKDLGDKAKIYGLNGISFVPLFNEPFVKETSEIKSFKILNLASAYWKGNENNEQLIRITSVGFSDQAGLENYLSKVKDAQERSHLKIGKEQGLFVISDLVGPGLPLLAPKGMTIRREIVKFLWELHQDEGYQWVWTPHIAKDLLYKKSGHWDKFGDELFHVKGGQDSFILKPMNCPHHMQIFDHFSYSYRDMPIRFFEPATVYRDEKSGQLIGLSRVRSITQDDGHIFCRLSQIKDEVSSIVKAISKFYEVMGMDNEYWVSLSVRGEDKSKYLGSDEGWNLAEQALEEAAKECNLPYKRITGEAAFYGPKLDFMFKDALGREWQLATIQGDFNLPERFDLSFMNEESKKERPIVIHRAITGALERFMSVLIEHYAGKFPLWLSPVQVKIVTITDRNIEFAKTVEKRMLEARIRVEVDDRSESMGKKVRDAQLEKVNYIVTIGDKEQDKGTLAVRNRAGEQTFGVDVGKFVEELVEERDSRK